MTLPESEERQSDTPPSKRLKLDESTQCSSSNDSGLLGFCDDLLLEILSYLKPTDLLALSQCCQRLHRVACDRTLWVSVDFRPKCLTDAELRKYVKFFLPCTKVIASSGSQHPPLKSEKDRENPLVAEPSSSSREDFPCFTGELMESITKAAPNLTTLILHDYEIDAQDVTWEKVPQSLEHLSLRRCRVTNLDPNKSFFFGIDKILPLLKKLDMSDCHWFKSISFLALSKCKQLQELRLADCLLMDFVPYISLGTRFGFKALTVVDLRRTWVSDREVSCLNKTPTLRELYLESPGGSNGSNLISDLAITAFGGTLEDWNRMGYFVVLTARFEGFMPSSLHVIHMQNYVSVSDTSLRHCASCLKGLRELNVKGTSCTQAGVMRFMLERPDVSIESNFDLEIEESTASVDNT